MASSKERERKLARAKIERQQARRAERIRRHRATLARVAAGLSLLLIFVLVSWSFDWYGLFKKPVDAAGCTWNTVSVENSATKKTGTPPPQAKKTTGQRDMTIKTDQGEIDVALDATNAPCSTESFTYLAGQHFFDNTTCHRLTTADIYILQCGDPSGTGTGGPSYEYPDENLPIDFKPATTPTPSASASASPSTPDANPSASNEVIYPAGTIAMANSGPDTNSSQFFIVYKDSPFAPNYSVVGKVTNGLDVVLKIAKGGVQDVNGTDQTDGKPNMNLTILSLAVTDPASRPAGSPSPTAAAPSASQPSAPHPSAPPPSAPEPSASASSKS